MLLPLSGRLVSLALDGGFEGYIMPMVIEAVLGVAGFLGAWVLSAKASEG